MIGAFWDCMICNSTDSPHVKWYQIHAVAGFITWRGREVGRWSLGRKWPYLLIKRVA